MNIYNHPTPEEINEAAINEGLRYGVGRYAIVEITFKRAISWLQNYQTQQQGVVKTAEEILDNANGPLITKFERSFILKMMHEFHNQFQTPASGGSEWISVEDKLPNNAEEITAKCSHGQIANKAVYEDGRFVHRFNSVNKLELVDIEIKNVTHWQYTGHSSQPQPNAISVIEEEIAELSKTVKFEAVRNKPIIEMLNDLLTKLKK